MKADLEVAKALGRYRGSWLTAVTLVLIGVVLMTVQMQIVPNHQWQSLVLCLPWVAFLTAVWLIPQTVISPTGIRLVWRCKFISWTDVVRIYQAGPGDPNIVLGLRSGKALSLPGVKQDRLPGIVVLAQRFQALK